VRWLLVKDLQIMRRSPLLVGLLVVYPVVISLLIGFALSRSPDRPKVAFLNQIPETEREIALGGERFPVSRYEAELFQSIDPIRVGTRDEALAKVRDADALAAIVIPPDLTRRLATGLESARIEVIYNGDALKQQYVEAAIDSKLALANAALAQELRQIATRDVELLLNGGRLTLLGRQLDILGLRNTKAILDATLTRFPGRAPDRRALERVARFADLAVDNLDLSKKVLGAVSRPIAVERSLISGSRTPLDAFAIAMAVTVSLMFVCVLLAAGLLALEREENAFSRLVRGLVGRGTLLAEKIALAAACSLALALLMLVGIGTFVALEWERLPLWVAALAAGAAAFGALGVAIGALAREVRAASLLAVLLTLPIAFLALVPSGAVAGPLYDVVRVVSASLPFKPALQGVDAALNRSEPGVGQSVLHLLALTAAFGAVARLALRRLA
jgi:ABC-type multidrug transport system permease subunit